MKITLSDVAQKAGVSLATASRVINNSSHKVRDDLRNRVLQAVAELNYVPNAHARALVQHETSTVGIIVHDVSDPYFAEITRGIQRVASEHERLVIICNSYRNPERELAYIDMLRSQRVAAIILAGSGRCDDAFTEALTRQITGFRATGGRVTCIGRHEIHANSVRPDNYAGGRIAAETLIQLKHQHITVITGPQSLTTTHDRLDGFRAALNAAGLELPDNYIVRGDFTRQRGYEAMIELLDRDLDPAFSAVFAASDPAAIGALAALRDRGFRVPEDVSVIGFDDIGFAQDVMPALTTIQVSMNALGHRAMQLVLSDAGDDPVTEILPCRLIVRDSTAIAKSN